MQLTPLKKTLFKRLQLPAILLLSLGISGTLLVAFPLGRNLLSRPDSPHAYPYAQDTTSDNPQTIERSIAFYQGRIQQRPSDGLDRAALAGAYLKMARVTGAENWYLLATQEAQQSLDNLSFNNDGALMVLAEVAQAEHEFAEAVRLAEQASGPKSLTVVITSKLAMGELAEAEKAADAAVNFVPSLGSLSLRGLARMAKGNHRGALSDFQQAIAAEEPTEQRASAQVRTFLGRLYAAQGNSTSAEQLYREALRIVPDYPLALLNLAQLKTRLGHFRAAKKHYAQLSQSVASEGIALQGLARISTLQSRPADAEWQRAEAVLRAQINQNALGHRRDLAHLLLEKGREEDVPEAIALMQTETKTRRDAETLNILAWALSRGGRWQDAQRVIREAVDQGVQDASIFYRAVEIETTLNQSAEAEKYVRLAQSLDPTFEEQTRRRLGQVSP